MGYPIRYEKEDEIFFITSRTSEARLWFINCPQFEYMVKAYLAKYAEMFGVILYAFTLMGNHYHLLASFPRLNKAKFMQAFNSIVARLAQTHISGFSGRLWGRRYADQAVVGEDAIENWFFYIALNPVTSGIVKSVSDYKHYNSFFDSVRCRHKKYKLLNRSAYYEAKRSNKETFREEFIEEYTLQFERLPGYEELDDDEYQKVLTERLFERQEEAIIERRNKGQGFASKKYLARIKIGDKPSFSKVSTRYSLRPLVLTLCRERRQKFLDFYFTLRQQFFEASKKYLLGDISVSFPAGTYAPHMLRI